MNELIDLSKIEMFAREVDIKIKSLTEMTDQLRQVKQTLDHIRLSQENRYILEVKQLRDEVAHLQGQLEAIGVPKISLYEKKLQVVRQKLQENDWPSALETCHIPQGEDDEKKRAINILDLIVTEYLKGVKFLDFGCGPGYVAHAAAAREVVLSVGYDLQKRWAAFQPTERFLLTDDFAEVRRHAPYDVVLLYDVLDHCKGDPVETLHRIRDLLSARGRVYVRNHPWCSRHGSHLYKQINKAFVHLVLDEVELARVGGYCSEHTIKLVRPVEKYNDWFDRAGFLVRSEIVIANPSLEEFFTSHDNSVIRERVCSHWEGEDPTKYMIIQFVDYLLEPKTSDKQIF